MSMPAEGHVLADTGGLVVTDDGRRVLVFDRNTGGLAVVSFVLGIITLVVGGFGVVALFAMPIAVGVVFIAGGALFAIGTAMALRAFRRRRTQPLNACRSVAVIDRKLGIFSYAGGALLPLDQVQFQRRMQPGSSSPKLVAILPGGTTQVLKRGNPFDGGIGDVDQVLNATLFGARR